MRHSLLRLTLVALVMIVSQWASAYDFEVGGLYYKKLTANSVALTYGSSIGTYSGDVIIPAEVTYNGVDYAVTEITGSAFSACKGLSSVIIPEGVTTIRYNAFAGCKANSLTIAGSVTLMEYDPMNGAEIGTLTFAAGESPLDIQYVLRSSSTGYGSLGNCNLTNVIINRNINGLKKSGSGSGYYYSNPFQGNKYLQSVQFGEDVTNMLVFDGCVSLKTVNIPPTVTSLPDYAFYKCKSLTSVEIPESVTSIGDYAFRECTSLTTVKMGSLVEELGDQCFYGCSSLKELRVQNPLPPTCKSASFTGVVVNQLKVVVPDGSKQYYEKADVWKDFVCIVEDAESGNVKELKAQVAALESELAELKAKLKGDVNEDGEVSIEDVNCLIEILLEKGE